jgi:hypothetical protein
MTKAMKNFLKGMGSVVDVAPSKDFSKLVPTASPQERMRGHWTRTGKAIQEASGRFSHARKK